MLLQDLASTSRRVCMQHDAFQDENHEKKTKKKKESDNFTNSLRFEPMTCDLYDYEINALTIGLDRYAHGLKRMKIGTPMRRIAAAACELGQAAALLAELAFA